MQKANNWVLFCKNKTIKYFISCRINSFDNILIIFQMLAFNQTFKNKTNMNIYTDRNHTDQLYEPLREALRKSTLSMSYLYTDKRNSYEYLSPQGKKMRILSPTQAENIKNGIFIPVNKELVPTRNLQKILGKKFTPVDYNQKVGEALTPEQFNMMRQGGVQQIIYQIHEQQSYRQNFKGSQHYKISTITKNIQKEQLPKPLFVSHSSKELIQGRQLSLSLANQSSNNKGSPAKPYLFRQSIRASQKSSNTSKDNVDQSRKIFCNGGCCSQNDAIDTKFE